MSYWLEDADGEYLGDLATNVGINQLRELGGSIEEFLDAGVADEDLLADVYNEAGEHSQSQYLKDLLRDANAPVYVTDGCGHADDVENVFCPNGPGGGVNPSCSPGGSAAKTDKELLHDYTRSDGVHSEIKRGYAVAKTCLTTLSSKH